MGSDAATRAIIFDLDDTLLAQDVSDHAALRATCMGVSEEYGVDPAGLVEAVQRRARSSWYGTPTGDYCHAIGISPVEGLWARFLGDNPNLRALRAWGPIYRRDVWSRALADRGVRDLARAEELSERFQRERRARHVVYPEVEATLTRLRGAYRLALLTNGAPDLQREKLAGAGLAHHFATIVVSGDVGIGKPDRRIFDLVLNRLDVPASAAVMVGDSRARDIAGAQGAGIRAVWINRAAARRHDGDDGIVPDAEIAHLDDVPISLR